MSVMGMTKNRDKKDIYSYIILKDQRIIWTIKGKIISFLFFLIKVDKIMKVEISLYRIYSRTKNSSLILQISFNFIALLIVLFL